MNEAQLRGCHQHERWKLCCSMYARFSYTPRKSSLNRALQVDSGFLEAIVRGYKAGILSQSHYANLTQCESLEDFRTQLSATDYGNFLFNYIRTNAVAPLSKFLSISRHYGYMIDNVVLLITGTLHERDTHELLERSLCVATNVEELYQSVLVETPLGLSSLLLILGSPTSDVMHRLLSFEADRRTVNITINSFGTELSKEQRAKLFPAIGRLFPEGNNQLAKADDIDQVRVVCENISEYRSFFDGASSSANSESHGTMSQLEDRFFNMEVHLNKQSFLQQFQYGVFYSYMKLKEQEIRNLTWIAECIAQDAKDRIQDFIPIF
ncbi:H(+)-transporting V0 sector ATPase [Salix suchowensis]|nr:H(+)-transporting V0 sector ATPase [Salix suchowensis]